MKFNFLNLDQVTRKYMLQAIEEAEESGNIYFSARFNNAGHEQWLKLLKQAAEKYDEHWLAFQLESLQLMKDFEGARKPLGGYSIKHVPHNAAETMAEGQFNRFYILGLCKRARTEGLKELEIYRAKDRDQPRESSQMLIEKKLPIGEIVDQLGTTQKSFSSPLVKPNSGISVKLP